MANFDDIFGQEAAVEALRGAYVSDRLAHGLLFAGPMGVGKRTTADALAALWLCEKPAQTRPCGVCQSCRALGAQTHPDYHWVAKELIRYHDKTGLSKGISLSIDVIRPELIEPATRKAFMGRGKVFVIRQAELMTAAAQNALLKTLEEPAGRTLIILLSDDPDGLLPTVRSRCQVVRFVKLPSELVVDELEKRGIDRAVAAAAARLADGSLGIALKWIQDGVVEPARQLHEKLEGILAGRVVADLPAFFRAGADTYAEKQIQRDELASKDQATREGLAIYLRLAADFFRAQLPSAGDDSDGLASICRAIDAVSRAGVYLDANVNIPLVFQQLSLKLRGLRAGDNSGRRS